ncbi:hypothetical protein CPB86DRAFT_725142, partial [Serendipita vermifera]
MLPLALLLLAFSQSSRAARSSSIPEDIYAYPKFKIQFLNSRPLLNFTAQQWLQHGLNDENEFLGLPKSSSSPTNLYKKIASGPADELAPSNDDAAQPASAPLPVLQQMRLGSSEFLCLLLPPPDLPAPPEEAHQAPQPIHSWELLQPLEGTCLYHRQGWFSYAYCHGQHVRQFREKEPNLPLGTHAASPFFVNPFPSSLAGAGLVALPVPQEDPNEPSYTLGNAPVAPQQQGHEDEGQAHLSVPEKTALANRLELARGAGHRYLNLHWGDGTVCDKTGKKREIEVQTKTCQYTLVIHTPRLCGEPGFKSPREDVQDTPLRCRKIVETLDATDPTLPDAASPLQRRKPKPLPAPPAGSGSGSGGSGSSSRSGAGDKAGSAKENMDKQEMRSQLIKAALDALFGRNQEDGNDNTANNNADPNPNGQKAGEAAGNLEKFIAVTMDEDGEIYVDSLDDRLAPLGELKPGDNEDEEILEIELAGGEDAVRLMKILREAGYDAHLPGDDDDQ